jgi:hypothetical protein
MTDFLIYHRVILSILRKLQFWRSGYDIATVTQEGKTTVPARVWYVNTPISNHTPKTTPVWLQSWPLAFLHEQSSKRGQIRKCSHPLISVCWDHPHRPVLYWYWVIQWVITHPKASPTSRLMMWSTRTEEDLMKLWWSTMPTRFFCVSPKFIK